MIRPAIREDRTALLTLIEASGLFPPSELTDIAQLLDDYHQGALGEGHNWIVDDQQGELVSSAYYAAERFTDGTWNLLMIVVHPDRRRQGFAAQLVRHIEQSLAGHGHRVLLVETSSLPLFEGARTLYRQCGFDEEARIRDYYRESEDKFIYRRKLAAGA